MHKKLFRAAGMGSVTISNMLKRLIYLKRDQFVALFENWGTIVLPACAHAEH